MDSTLITQSFDQSFFTELIGLLPLWLQVILVLVVIPIIFLVYRFATNEDFRNGAIKVISIFKSNKLKLDKHELFYYKTLSAAYIDRLDIGSKLKTDILKIVLTKKIGICIRNIEYFLVRYKTHLKDDDNISLRKEFSDLIERCVAEYEIAIQEEMKIQYKKDSVFLYNKVYSESFEPYHSTNISYLLKVVERFNNSKISKDQKVHMFFNLIQVALDMAVMDCERTFRELNGSLKEYEEKYK